MARCYAGQKKPTGCTNCHCKSNAVGRPGRIDLPDRATLRQQIMSR
jgi:hypothetical protein